MSDVLRLVVKQDGGVTLLRLDEIDCFEADGNVVSVLTSSGETHQLREPLAKLLEQLASRGFIRIHRGAIVRSAAVVAVEKGRYRKAFVVLRGGAKLEIGRAEFQKLRALWQPGLLDLRELGAGLQLVAVAQ